MENNITPPSVVAVTSGDPASVATITTLQCWESLKNTQHIFVLLADYQYIVNTIQKLKLNIPTKNVQSPHEALEVFHSALPIINIKNDNFDCTLGLRDEKNASFILKSLNKAISLANNKEVSSICTNPLDKNLINTYTTQSYQEKFLGHTQYLYDKDKGKKQSNPIMLLATQQYKLKVVPITTHISIKEVPNTLNKELIIETAKIIYNFLKEKFNIKQPKLLFTALNPHCGEGGLMGKEEITIIAPALKILNTLGIPSYGAISTDTAFCENNINNFDVILGMYHDQVLSPFKALYFHEGVNITAGLSFIRTSPDHGTAFNIADNINKINYSSLKFAIMMASNMANSSMINKNV